MQTGWEQASAAEIDADALIVPAFEKDAPRLGTPADEAITGFYESGEFTGKEFTTAVLHNPEGLKAKRLVLAGCGKKEDFTPARLRKVTGAALRRVRSKAVRHPALLLREEHSRPDYARAAVEGALAGAWDPDRYKTGGDKNEKKTASFTIAGAAGGDALRQAVIRGRVLGEAMNFARELAAEPANRLGPSVLAERARKMASENGLECEVLDRERMKQLGMGALLGVAQGSVEPPALIIVRYRPEKPGNQTAHLGLVGKGVTFDTGGISIKPSEKMDEMKYDMSGGATMLAALRAIAQLKPSLPVTAVIPAVENMPGGRAQRPGDIVETLSGKTVEVLNTDAEGRLILADALTYAQRLGCTHLVDAATLTGAIVVALGHVNVGVFSNNDDLLDRLLRVADIEGEKMWQMPLDEEYKKLLKSPVADLPNIGPRWGGAITAACFLKEFAEPLPWLHLDIAGAAYLDGDEPYLAKGPTGVAVRSLVRLATDW